MKKLKLLSLLAALTFSTALFAACGGNDGESSSSAPDSVVSSEEVVDSSEDEASSEEIVESSEEVASSEEVESSEEIEGENLEDNNGVENEESEFTTKKYNESLELEEE